MGFQLKLKRSKILPVQLLYYLKEDVEAQPFNQQQRSSSTTRNQIYNIVAQDKHFLLYAIIVVITLCVQLVPLFTQTIKIENITNSGIFAHDLQSSTRLMIMESVSIGCTLPMLSDSSLDRVTDKTKMTLSMWHRILFLLIFSISGIFYLSFSDCYFMPYLYIVSSRFKVLLVGAITSYAVSSGTVVDSWKKKGKLVFVVPVLVVAMFFVVEIYTLLYPGNHLIKSIYTILFYLSYISFTGVQIPWFYHLLLRYRVSKTLTNEEKKETVYMLAMIFYVVACALVNVVFGWPESWLEVGESYLIGYIVVQIVCILLATVLPARFMRKIIQMSEAILELKREFVRYVSHEIRSPLNVVHAGLELLRADLTAAGALPSTLSLLQDIFFGSSTAIEILNDMLQYEHIDSGSFKLDCAAVPMLQAFAGRLDGFKFMVANKNITLHIEDLAQVSEYYSPSNESQQAGEGLDRPLSTLISAPPTASLVLFIDKFRVEQIIRNLITNAVKFTPEGGNVTIRFLVCSEDLLQRQVQRLDALSPETVGYSAETLSVVGRFLRIEVQDSGVGIAIEDQPEVFKKFTQFNRNALQGGGGSGLGLWICKNLAAFHGGRLGFHSEGKGKGSTFFADLPIFSLKESSTSSVPPSLPQCTASFSFQLELVNDEQHYLPNPSANTCAPSSGDNERDDEDEEKGSSGAVLLPRPHSSLLTQPVLSLCANETPTKVLIVDDSSMNRKMIRRMLESPVNAAVLGALIVEEADDGSTALKALETAAYAHRLVPDNALVVERGDSRNRWWHDDDSIINKEGDMKVDLEEGGSRKRPADVGFDLVFIDYVMTTMNGPEAVQIMRRDLMFAGGIIGVTGNALPSDLTYFKECGADVVITKPLTNKKLMDAIQSVTHANKGNRKF